MFLLDVLVEHATLYRPCSFVRSPIWITINADGLHQTFHTGAIPPCERTVWNCPARLILNLHRLDGMHFKVALRTHGGAGESVIIAASQVSLNTLGGGRPNRFAFPLLNPVDRVTPAAQLTMSASISEVALQPPVQIREERPVQPVPQICPTGLVPFARPDAAGSDIRRVPMGSGTTIEVGRGGQITVYEGNRSVPWMGYPGSMPTYPPPP
jgi:hypothetical protein